MLDRRVAQASNGLRTDVDEAWAGYDEDCGAAGVEFVIGMEWSSLCASVEFRQS